MGEYHEDDTLSWLASQFAEGLVQPSKQAKAAFDEIMRLREQVKELRLQHRTN